MKKFSKILAVLLALCMVLAVSAFASGEPASGEPSSEEPAAAGKSVEEAYIDYIREFLTAELAVNSSMMPEHVEEIIAAVQAGQTDTFPGDILYNGMLVSGNAMTFDEFAAQYVPEGGSGEAMSVEDAYIEYLHEWLIAEDEVNDTMTEDIRENEFMPLIRAWNFTDFPAEMLWSGMLETGVPMTFEEFSAQYVPAAAPAAGNADPTSFEAFVEYLHQWLLAELAVNSNMTIEQVEDEFMPLIEAGNFTDFPAEMLWSGMLEQGVPMTYDEFVAAGGVY